MDIRQFFFRNRSYTPVPLALAIIYYAEPGGALTVIGSALIIMGELIRLSGVRYAGGATRTRKVGAPALCTDGPYAYVRNPLYVGNIIIYAGIILFAGGGRVWFLLGLTLTFFFVQYGLIISLEEETLRGKFGVRYEAYVSLVPRLIPRISPWSGRSESEPIPWRKTLRTERRSLQTLSASILLILVWRLFSS